MRSKIQLLNSPGWSHSVDIYVQYPKDTPLIPQMRGRSHSFSLDGRRFFHVLVTSGGVRVDSDATMGKRRYYYEEKVTLRFDRKGRPVTTAKGHPPKPVGFAETVFALKVDMERRGDSYCGLYCGACKCAECEGCKVLNERSWKPDCRFRECATQHGVDVCCYCTEFPCGDLVRFNNDKWAHHSSVLPNLNRIKEVGLEAWLSEQQVRWSCPKCKQGFTWYDKTCNKCGTKLLTLR